MTFSAVSLGSRPAGGRAVPLIGALDSTTPRRRRRQEQLGRGADDAPPRAGQPSITPAYGAGLPLREHGGQRAHGSRVAAAAGADSTRQRLTW